MRWNKLSAGNQTVEEFLIQKRNDLVILQQKANEYATRTFDDLGQYIRQQIKILQLRDNEIKRLEELCEKNKIDHKPKDSQKNPKWYYPIDM